MVLQRSPSSDESSIFFGSIRLPWPGPACPGTRGPPFLVQVPQMFSPGDPPHQCSSVVELPPSRHPPLLPSPRAPASPQRRSLACSLSRSLEVPCLPFPFPALRAGASRESTSGCPDPMLVAAQSDLGDVRSSAPSLSTARPSAGGRPLEVAVVACSRSTAACVVLASAVSTPPVSRSLSVACTLFFTLVTGPPMPPLTPRTSSFAYLPWVFSVSFDSSVSSDWPSLHFLLPGLSRGSPQNPAYLPLPPLLGPTTRPVGRHSLPDRLPPVAPLLDAELGISLPDALDALKHGPSVLIVVETKMSVISHACVRTLMRQPFFGFLPACGTASGILLALSPPLTGVIVHVSRYSISASLSGFWPNGPVLVTAVYGPCVGALRGQLWAELLQVRQVVASPWLLAGDFNCLLSPADSSSPVTSGPSMSAFRSFVEEFSLFDVPSTNGTFTWSNNRNPPILCRLDRIFLSPELFSAFPSSSLVLGPRHLSDHASLLLSLLRGRAGIGHARFRFELWWLRDESFVATVPNWWARAVNGRWAAFRLSRKLHSIRREALAWKRIFWK
ncbi:hypothetical protein EJ110_NYTH56489 [Nymphaea thermarum]|nr:hypothetical protein EJ110_NYTH56489 [Nymphaea thermarum]